MNFGSPEMLVALAALPIVWLLLRLIPPKPTKELFGATTLLLKIAESKQTPHKTPWWVILMRLAIVTCCILAIANPLYNPTKEILSNNGDMLVIVDDRWDAAQNWDNKKVAIQNLVEEAKQNGNLVTLVRASEDIINEPKRAEEVSEIIEATQPTPINNSTKNIAREISQGGYQTIVWFANGISDDGNTNIVRAINQSGAETIVYAPENPNVTIINQVENQGDALVAKITRLFGVDNNDGDNNDGVVTAYDIKGRPIATSAFSFEADEQIAEARFDSPIELRNQFVRLAIQETNNAGAVQLLDEKFRQKRVGIMSGEIADRAQPLLSHVYYASRALRPFSEIRTPKTSNPIAAIDELIEDRVDVIVLADIGTLPEQAKDALEEWISKGGTLVRFAGPRFAGADEQNLVPVELRGGERRLVGTLTWSTPQKLTRFNLNSPFAEIKVPNDVLVRRQVLAEPQIDLAERTWAELEDGTPLVTATEQGQGRIILFHVTADTSWSDLPLSGTFVEMLKAINTTAISLGQKNDGRSGEQSLAPFKMLNGFGELTTPETHVRSLGAEVASPTIDNPPGLYGSQTTFAALNLFDGKQKIQAMEMSFPDNPNVTTKHYDAIIQPYSFKPWLLIAAICLFIADGLARIFLSGGLTGITRLNPRTATAVASVGFVAIGFVYVYAVSANSSAYAQNNNVDYSAALETRLAYVVTGDARLDEITKKGVSGLTQYLARYTAIEPAAPHGINVAQDELSFYPLIYWAIDENSPIPTTKTMARVDAYMKKGGTVIFDTRNLVTTPNNPETIRLRQILRSLDIPPLEPVPNDHVLTRTFYLLDTFPGRYRDGTMWVEKSTKQKNQVTRRGDGVSSIIITSNDLAGAWATEPSGLPTLPTIPNHPRQRELAFRTGVNIVMYTLTGNYKADQVHAPEILRRLGQ